MKQVIEAMGSATQLANFIEGGGLYDILGLIGHVEIEAAQDALKYANLAVDADSVLREAIGHLRTAHISFKKIYHSFVQVHVNAGATMLAQEYDKLIMVLTTQCYLYLGEVELAKKWISEEGGEYISGKYNPGQIYEDRFGEGSFTTEALKATTTIVLSWTALLNPLSLRDIWKSTSLDQISNYQFEKFRKDVMNGDWNKKNLPDG